ncbi:MAG: aspartate-semialdehyde dehydrogenase [Planctomycetota bacterium]|nr:MAG: aspartate-semialdehyde dehydrogenase [Planctomycetota bacterium]
MRVGIVGATGAVGRELLRVLHERRFPVRELRLFASPRSAGRHLPFGERTVAVQPLDPDALAGLDLVLTSAGSTLARRLAPALRGRVGLVVDNSSAFRMDEDVPLVVPEVNPDALAAHTGLVANPNCTTIIALLAVAPLHREAGLERLVCASYQAASGAGARALEELERQQRALAAGEQPPPPEVLPRPLAHNVIPHIDRFEPGGYTREELKIERESRRILGCPALRVSSTCVRVPVPRAHAVALQLEFERPLLPERARALLEQAPGLEVIDDPELGRYPTPLDVSGRDHVAVGRIRADRSHPRGLALWVVGDQLRKGAALNAVQIAERAFGIGERATPQANAPEGTG